MNRSSPSEIWQAVSVNPIALSEPRLQIRNEGVEKACPATTHRADGWVNTQSALPPALQNMCLRRCASWLHITFTRPHTASMVTPQLACTSLLPPHTMVKTSAKKAADTRKRLLDRAVRNSAAFAFRCVSPSAEMYSGRCLRAASRFCKTIVSSLPIVSTHRTPVRRWKQCLPPCRPTPRIRFEEVR